ncbi:MAG: zinc dependent phospholipase C family protein [Thermosynechococcaceae cyanobacterium MS004]|nr:zinc dependent phospholipase C family protein [Thermosynechococcaceae cyanobacterium MS004]
MNITALKTSQLSIEKFMLIDISASSDGLVWGIDSSGYIYQYDNLSKSWQQQKNDLRLTQISIGNSTNIWGISDAGMTLQYDQTSQNWQPMSEKLTLVAAAADGSVFGLNSEGEIFQYEAASNSWQIQPTTLKLGRIAVGSGANIWGLDSTGAIYQYEPVTLTWQLIPGELVCISAAEDGTVFGLNQAGDIFLYVGEPQMTWYQCDGVLQEISVASSTQIWGIDLQGNPVDLSPPVQSDSVGENYAQTHGSILPKWDAEDPFDETRSTHLWIVKRAVRLAAQEPNLGAALVQLIQPNLGKIGNNGFHDNLCQGLYDADFLPQYNNPSLIGQPTYKSHFYDPDTGLNWLNETEPTALTNGRQFFNLSLDYYRSGDMKNAGYNLGLSLHYLTDLTQPMHAANYTWLSSYFFGYHTGFESYVMQIQSQVRPPEKYKPLDLGSDPDAYLIRAAQQSKHNYSDNITINTLAHKNYGFVPDSLWQQEVRPYIDPILQDAITITAQYLIAWFRSCQETPLYRLCLYPYHFYTASAVERDYAKYKLGYSDEGVACQVYSNDPPAGTVPFYRLCRYPDHLYTTSEAEKSKVMQWGYDLEGKVGYVFPPNQPQPKTTIPLYRLLHPEVIAHFYTTSSGERDYAVNTLHYKYEGVACYVPITFSTCPSLTE